MNDLSLILQDLLSCYSKLDDTPYSAESHLEQAIARLLSLTEWRPVDKEGLLNIAHIQGMFCGCGGKLQYFGEALMQSLQCSGCDKRLQYVGDDKSIYDIWENEEACITQKKKNS